MGTTMLLKHCNAILFFIVHLSCGIGSVKQRRHRRSATECPSEIIEDDANFRVFLTVNALTLFAWNGNLQQRKLELNWTPPPDGIQDGDWIGLFRRGRGSRERTLARVNPQQDQDGGYHKTDVTFPR